MNTQNKAQRARVLRLQNAKTLKTKSGFCRFVIGGKFAVTPYDRRPSAYYAEAEAAVVALDSL